MQNPMMAGMATGMATQFLSQSGVEIPKNLDKYVSIGQLKYYFAVDTSYVAKKIGVLLFPFTRSDWAIKYNQDEPVQPKYDLNAPDLYIPTMAYATYVLLVGYILGLRNAFSPDLLGITASSTLVWLILEFGLIHLTLFLMGINTSLTVVRILHFLDLRVLSTDMVFDKDTQAKDRTRGSWDASSRQTKTVYYPYVCSIAASFDLVDDL